MKMPALGGDKEKLLAKLATYAANDAPWRSGRTFAYVYDPGPDVEDIAKRAYTMYLTENGLDPTAFPSVLRLENEIVAYAAAHLNAPPDYAGNFTSGGTESCMLAVKTARDYARAVKPHITAPEIILPVTAHAAFHKGAHYLGLKKVLVPVDPETYKADWRAIEAAVTPNTVLIVASAVSYAHGVLDPIQQIGLVAQKHDILFHVDGCIGGFLLPYFRRLNPAIYPFDFSVPGVTSMSMDWHKYGYCPKGASTIIHRSKELRRYQFFACAEYTGYTLVNPTILSTKSGGPMAAAWAVINYLGDAGYMRFAERIYKATRALVDGIRAIPGLRLLADPDTNLIAFTANDFSCFHLVDLMKDRGWLIQPQLGAMGSVDNIHLSVGQSNLEQVDEFLSDLRWAVGEGAGRGRSNVAAVVRAEAAKLKPSDFTPETLRHLNAAAGLEGGKMPKGAGEVNQLLDALPPKLAEVVLTDFFNNLYKLREE